MLTVIPGGFGKPRALIPWKRIALILGVVGVIAAGAFDLSSRIGAKADASEVRAVASDVRTLQVDHAHELERNRWRDATLWKVADKLGIPVPPPPTP